MTKNHALGRGLDSLLGNDHSTQNIIEADVEMHHTSFGRAPRIQRQGRSVRARISDQRAINRSGQHGDLITSLVGTGALKTNRPIQRP